MKKYELCVVLSGDSKEEDREKLIKEIKDDIEKAKGKIGKVDDWGKKTLAFRMKKQTEGYYYLINLEFEDAGVNDLSKKLRMNEKILRFLLIKEEK